MNNEVRGIGDRLIGFRCVECGNIYESGWGDTCNKCRKEEQRHRELVNAIRERGKQ